VVSHRATQVRVISPAGLPAHADGEPIGLLATPFEAVPQALLAITPTNDDGRRRAQTARWMAPVVSPAAAAALGAGSDLVVDPSAAQGAARTMRWRVVPEAPPKAPGGGAG
jgi:hypothetical protein